jgi:hypothetical protein
VPSVRYSAVDAISERNPAEVLARAVMPLSLVETDFQLRASCVNLVARWLADLPWLAPTLERIAKNDPNADLRNTATTALSYFKSTPPQQPAGDPGARARRL